MCADELRINSYCKNSPHCMTVLGISAYYADAAAALVADNALIAAAQEERFNRAKSAPVFPAQAIAYCIKEAQTMGRTIDLIACYLPSHRQHPSLYSAGVIHATPSSRQKERMRAALHNIVPSLADTIPVVFPPRETICAAAAFLPSPFTRAAILTINGSGDATGISLAMGHDAEITQLERVAFPHSIGVVYSAATAYLGFSINADEYKVMGLAPYGNPHASETQKFTEILRQTFLRTNPGGLPHCAANHLAYTYTGYLRPTRAWQELFGFPPRAADAPVTETHCNFAYALQRVTEEFLIALVRYVKKRTACEHLCMNGDVALNCVANAAVRREGIFADIYIPPAPAAAGCAVGAALYTSHTHAVPQRDRRDATDVYHGALRGPAYATAEIRAMNKRCKACATYYESFDDVCAFTAARLAEGAVVGWMQGRMEFGPRALGNRSILADPRLPSMQKRLNATIKFREEFRPFAPAVRAEKCADYFDLAGASPYMLYTAPLREERRVHMTSDTRTQSLADRLATVRSDIPAVTHVDYSARVQTVDKDMHPAFYALLCAFEKTTGCAVLINTSFNVRGEPIVCTPEDAYRCFMHTDMDYLVIEGFVYDKRAQSATAAVNGEGCFSV